MSPLMFFILQYWKSIYNVVIYYKNVRCKFMKKLTDEEIQNLVLSVYDENKIENSELSNSILDISLRAVSEFIKKYQEKVFE